MIQIWGKYVENLRDLSAPDKKKEALACLNELVTDALRHIPDGVEFLSSIRNPSLFRAMSSMLVSDMSLNRFIEVLKLQ